MSVTKCAVAVEQATEQCDGSIQELSCRCTRCIVGHPCIVAEWSRLGLLMRCIVAEAVRNGHCEETKQLINAGK